MKIGFIGLGKMGGQMVTKLIASGHQVVVFDVNANAVTSLATTGALGATSRQDLVSQLPAPAVVWLMIPAEFLDPELDALESLLPAGSIIVDGGNSDFRHTQSRAVQLEAHGITLVDSGTSGGILGLAKGFSIMAGGTPEGIAMVTPIFEALVAPHGAWHHFGPSGSGHYVKMVHNGIEYGLMQAYAEGYQLLAEGPMRPIDLAAAADVWQHGSIIASALNGLVADIYHTNPALDGISGRVDETGEGAWTEEVAASAGVPMPALTAARHTRALSQAGQVSHATKLLAAMRNAFGGHTINKAAK